MGDDDCVHFLKWALPKLRLSWHGFRKVRGQVCKRVRRRMRALALDSVADYRSYLEACPDEWATLDSYCAISISRFYRDRAVFDFLRDDVLPDLLGNVLARENHRFSVWSAKAEPV